MMKKLMLMAVCVAMIAGSAMAIVVPEGDFETPTIGDNTWEYVEDMGGAWTATYYSGSPWVGNNYSYSGWYPGMGHTGAQWVDLNAGYIHQQLADTFVAGTTYELSVWLTASYEDQGVYLFFLDGADAATFGETTILHGYYDGFFDVAVEPSLQDWTQYTFEYTATAADDGNPIGIGIYGRKETYADDVAVTIVPEPATIALLSLGTLALRRRKKA